LLSERSYLCCISISCEVHRMIAHSDFAKHIHHLGQNALASRWNISPRTLERWRWRGEGPAYLKIGGRVAYRLADIEAFEAEQRRATSTVARPHGAPP
jgi:hypothetical protein